MRGSLILARAVVCTGLLLSGPTDAQQIKEIVGAVDVRNFVESRARFVGIVEGATAVNQGEELVISRACHQAFPGTRLCTFDEVLQHIPPVPESTWDGLKLLRVQTPRIVLCLQSTGKLVVCPTGEHPVMCCGF